MSGRTTDCRLNHIPQNVRQPSDARTIVLHLRAGLSSDVLAKLQDWRKCGRRKIVQLHELSYGLWHSCGSCAIKRKFIAWLSQQSCCICECEPLRLLYKYLKCLTAALGVLWQSVLRRSQGSLAVLCTTR